MFDIDTRTIDYDDLKKQNMSLLDFYKFATDIRPGIFLNKTYHWFNGSLVSAAQIIKAPIR